MPAFGFNTPFAEQLDFFRRKLNLPSERWDDIQRSAHDRAFIVAGAGRADLLNDLRGAVDSAINEGRGLESFRRDFDAIVLKNGWTGWTGEGTKAGEAWRTRVIYQTNMATSYAAGRYRQLTDPEFLKLRPYWRYVHQDGLLYPRPLHQAWGDMRLTLRHDHPFWATHFPPNGWFCHCRVTPVEAPAEGDASAPPEGWDAIDPKTGAPVGIDKGFDYAPGANANRPLQEFIDQKLINLDAPVGAVMMAQLAPAIEAERLAAYREWVAAIVTAGQTANEARIVGALSSDTVEYLAGQGLPPESAAITLRDAELLHLWRESKQGRGAAIPEADLMRLPEILAAPKAVLFDTEDPALLYVFASGADGVAGKVVVRVNFSVKVSRAGKRGYLRTNSVRTAGLLPEGNLKGERYITIEGGLE